MKKRISVALGILVFNGFVWGFFYFGVLNLFRGERLIALGFLGPSLLGLLLQPWSLIFFVLLKGHDLVIVLTTAVTIVLYLVLEESNLVKFLARRLSRLKKPGCAAIIGFPIVLFMVLGVIRHYDWVGGDRTVPVPLKMMTDSGALNFGDPRAYCIHSFIDSEYLFRANLTEKDLTKLASQLEMVPMPARDLDATFKKMPPFWWDPVPNDRVRAFTTKDFPVTGKGGEGFHVLATWDPENEMLHMWMIFNF